jgi:hypothetical protein
MSRVFESDALLRLSCSYFTYLFLDSPAFKFKAPTWSPTPVGVCHDVRLVPRAVKRAVT